MHSTFAVLAAVLAAAGARHARAQQLGWHTTIDASGNMLFGNAQDRLFAGRLQVGRADSTIEVRSAARFTYAESTDDEGTRPLALRDLPTIVIPYAFCSDSLGRCCSAASAPTAPSLPTTTTPTAPSSI